MAAVKTIGGAVVNTAGVALVSKTVTLKNDDTGAVLTTTTTNADGEWEFANRDETVRYRADAAFGGSSSQVVVRKPASAEFDHLYANLSFRTAAAATVAFGGSLTVAGNITATGAATITGTVNAGGAQIAGGLNVGGALDVDGTSTLNGTVLLGNAAAPAPVLAFTFDTDTGIASPAANQFAIRAGGSDIALFGATFVEVFKPVTLNDNLGVSGVATFDSQVAVMGALNLNGNVGFYSTPAVAKPTVTGSRGANAALTSLLTALATLGLVTNSSS
jgi:hypothetical protein